MNINIGLKDILLISPMITLLLASLMPITIKVLRGNREQNPLITLIQALIGLMVAAGLLVIFGDADSTAFYNSLAFDGITFWMGLLALGATAASMVLMYENRSTVGNQFSELIFLGLNSAVGMLILVSATDLLMVFIGLEMMSLALYLMIAMSSEQKLSKEAALKYFVLGSFASAVFLYGVALIFGSTGGTNILVFMADAIELVQTSRLFLFGITMVIIGFCFKVSIAPFHAWTPDVYQGAPTPHTAFMATAIKVVSFAAFIRIIATKSLLGSEHLYDMLQWLAVITMIVGNTAAILQNNFKRMIAYSSIAHSGYILVGVITAGVSDNAVFGASSVIFYLLTYGLMTIGTLGIVSMMENSDDHAIMVDDFAGFAKNRPGLALCMTIFLLSLAGIPPAMGFFGKLYLFNSAIGEGLIWLAIWGVISSVIGVYYYLRPVVVMYMKDGDANISTNRSSNGTSMVVILFAIAVLVLGFVSGPIFEAIERTLS